MQLIKKSTWNYVTAKSGDGVKILKSARGSCPFSVSFLPFISFSDTLQYFLLLSVLLPGFQNPLHSMPWFQGLLVVSSQLSLYLLSSDPNCIFRIFMFLKSKHLCFQSSVKIPNKSSHWVFCFICLSMWFYFWSLIGGLGVGGYKVWNKIK